MKPTSSAGAGRPKVRLLGLVRGALIALALVLLSVQAFALLRASWGFTTDDAWITLRYARNLQAGEGITWNAGETPVEGYSNFLYVVLGAAALELGLSQPASLKILGCGFLALALGALIVLGHRKMGALAAWIPALLFLSYWSVPYWTVSGLETPAYVAFVVLAFHALDRALREGAGEEPAGAGAISRSTTRWWLVGFWVLLAALARPEGPLVGIAIAAGLMTGRRAPGTAIPGSSWTWRTRLRAVAAVAATSALPYAAYTGWKLMHFGAVLPNSVRCKALFPGDPLVLARDAFGLVVWLLPTALFAVVRRRGAFEVAAFLFAASSIGILVGTDPIIGHGNRHFLAAWAVLLVVATMGAVDLLRILPRSVVKGWLEVLLVVAALVLSTRDLAPRVEYLRELAAGYVGREAVRERLASHLNEIAGPGDAVVIGDCGLVGFRVRARIYDALCLNDREASSPAVRDRPERYAALLLEREPSVVVIHSLLPGRLVPRPEGGIFRALVENPDFRAGFRPHSVVPGVGDGFNYFVFTRPGDGELERGDDDSETLR